MFTLGKLLVKPSGKTFLHPHQDRTLCVLHKRRASQEFLSGITCYRRQHDVTFPFSAYPLPHFLPPIRLRRKVYLKLHYTQVSKSQLTCMFYFSLYTQLKNMIAALYASRIDSHGTNQFEESGVIFGWEPIEEMLHREVQQKKSNQLP